MGNCMQHLAASEEMTDSAEASAAIHHKEQSEMIRVHGPSAIWQEAWEALANHICSHPVDLGCWWTKDKETHPLNHKSHTPL